jgi:hypothetical protein
MHLSSPPYVPHVLPISVFLTWSPEWYLVRSTELKALCYAVFSTPLLPHSLGPNILLSTLFSKTLSLHSSLNVILYLYYKLPMYRRMTGCHNVYALVHCLFCQSFLCSYSTPRVNFLCVEVLSFGYAIDGQLFLSIRSHLNENDIPFSDTASTSQRIVSTYVITIATEVWLSRYSRVLYKIGNVTCNVTVRRFRVTIFAMEKH